MKKISVLILLTLVSFVSHAQFNFGVKGGISTSKIFTNAGNFQANYKQSLAEQTGYVFGVWSRFGNKFFIQPEVLINSRGGKVYITPTNGNTNGVGIKTTHLDVPVLLGYTFLNRIRLMAGPVASIKLNENSNVINQVQTISGNTGSAFQNANFGYQAGVGITLFGLNVDLRKEGNFGNISTAAWANNSSFNQRQTGWQLTVGFKII